MGANTSREKVLQAIARKLGIAKLIGWHLSAFVQLFARRKRQSSSRWCRNGCGMPECQTLWTCIPMLEWNGNERRGAALRMCCSSEKGPNCAHCRLSQPRGSPQLNVTLTYPDCVQKVRVRLRKCLGENGAPSATLHPTTGGTAIRVSRENSSRKTFLSPIA